MVAARSRYTRAAHHRLLVVARTPAVAAVVFAVVFAVVVVVVVVGRRKHPPQGHQPNRVSTSIGCIPQAPMPIAPSSAVQHQVNGIPSHVECKCMCNKQGEGARGVTECR